MSFFNLFRSCWQQRLKTTLSHRHLQLRHKTYVKTVKKLEDVYVEVSYHDVLLYEHKNGKRVALIIGFAAAMALFFKETARTFAAVGQSLKSAHDKLPSEMREKSKGRFKIDMYRFKEGRYHKYFATFFYAMGALFLSMGILVPFRHIKSIVLMKNRANICLSTYAPFGRSKHIVIPSSNVYAQRTLYMKTGEAVYIKSTQHYLPFFVSSTGSINDPWLLNKYVFRRKS